MVQPSTYGSRTSAEDVKDAARDKISDVSNRLEDAADRVSATGRDVKENVQVVADNMRGALEKSIRDQPLTTLAMTAAVAFVIGAIWKS